MTELHYPVARLQQASSLVSELANVWAQADSVQPGDEGTVSPQRLARTAEHFAVLRIVPILDWVQLF